MAAKTDGQRYLTRAQHELDMAASTYDANGKALHLNMAAKYATLRERADLEISDARCDTNA